MNYCNISTSYYTKEMHHCENLYSIIATMHESRDIT